MPYIICGINEVCCDNPGAGGECCNECANCVANDCAQVLDGTVCRGSASLTCCSVSAGVSECFDLQNSNENCGDCGVECVFEGGEQCCEGVCHDIWSESDNCGSCGFSCSPPNCTCSGGTCVFGPCN